MPPAAATAATAATVGDSGFSRKLVCRQQLSSASSLPPRGASHRLASIERAARGICAHVEAARALHVHEEGVRRLHQALELVAALLKLPRRVQQIDIAHGDVRLARRGGERESNFGVSGERAVGYSADRAAAAGREAWLAEKTQRLQQHVPATAIGGALVTRRPV